MKKRTVGRNHPRVLRIEWNRKLGLPECPYVVRWMAETPLGSLRIHHWLSPDDSRAKHDHPWWFITIVLRGGYTDINPEHGQLLTAGSIRFRRASHQHTVVPLPRGAWTLLITGSATRKWGFWRDGKFIKANKWFATYGHHPCS